MLAYHNLLSQLQVHRHKAIHRSLLQLLWCDDGFSGQNICCNRSKNSRHSKHSQSLQALHILVDGKAESLKGCHHMDRHRLSPQLPLIASGSVDPFHRRLSKVAILPSHLIYNQRPLLFSGNLEELANP